MFVLTTFPTDETYESEFDLGQMSESNRWYTQKGGRSSFDCVLTGSHGCRPSIKSDSNDNLKQRTNGVPWQETINNTHDFS